MSDIWPDNKEMNRRPKKKKKTENNTEQHKMLIIEHVTWEKNIHVQWMFKLCTKYEMPLR